MFVIQNMNDEDRKAVKKNVAMTNILIAEPKDFSREAIVLLSEVAEVACEDLAQEELKTAMEQYDVIWIRLGLTVRRIDIPEYVRCKFLVTATTGLNHVDLQAVEEVGIKVLSLKGQLAFLKTITATAEHTMGLLLSLVRKIPAAHISVLSGKWNRDLFKGNEIADKKIGIVGYGRLGRIVGDYCQALRMKVIAYDPYVNEYEAYVTRVDSLGQLFSSADFVTLHIPLNSLTERLVGNSLLSLMKSSAFLINTSRGEILDEGDLLKTLQEKRIAGAALDVLCGEAFFASDNPLVEYARRNDNLLLTPHLGGCTWESMEKCEVFMANLLLRAAS